MLVKVEILAQMAGLDVRLLTGFVDTETRLAFDLDGVNATGSCDSAGS